MPIKVSNVVNFPAPGGFLGALGKLRVSKHYANGHPKLGDDVPMVSMDELDQLQVNYDAANAPASSVSRMSDPVGMPNYGYGLKTPTFGIDYSTPSFDTLNPNTASTLTQEQAAIDYGAGINSPYMPGQGPLVEAVNVNNKTADQPIMTSDAGVGQPKPSFYASNKKLVWGGVALAAALAWFKLS